MSFKTNTFDLVILGGGFVGGCLAVAAARLGLHVCVLEAKPELSRLPSDHDIRTTAIALGSQRLLEKLGVWDPPLAAVAEPIHDISISDAGSSTELRFRAADLPDNPAMGYIVNNTDLHAAIERALASLTTVERRWGVKVLGWEVRGAQAIVSLEDGAEGPETLSTSVVVGADGRTSWSREQAGLETWTVPYTQTALVCCVSHENPHQGLAHEHFTPTGPVALLPMAGLFSTLVWTTTPEAAAALCAADDDTFNTWLNTMAAGFPNIRGPLCVAGPRRAYPLCVAMLKTLVAERFAVVGDAAHVMHPVAGQGLNLGIRDIDALITLFDEARRCGLDLGSATLLGRYQSQRRPDHVALLGVTHGLIRLFSQHGGLLRRVRSLGLRLVNTVPTLQRFFMRRAMGV